MQTIGLIGGMSWESTVPYYRIINQIVKEQLGGWHSAKIILYSVDFQELEEIQHSNNWPAGGVLLAGVAKTLEAAGADLLLLCTNTMHKVADQLQAAVSIPLLHIADPTAAAIKAQGQRVVGLLGTRFTMEETFYRERMASRYGIELLVPHKSQRDAIHRIIYQELCLGTVLDGSRQIYQDIIADLVQRGAKGVILGCTEITLLIGSKDAHVPLFESTVLHARAAALRALEPRS